MASTHPFLPGGPLLIRTLVFAGVMLLATVSRAQVTTNIKPDGTTMTTVTKTVTKDGNVFNIIGETIRGRNLFHSFDLFSVGRSGGRNDIASFNGPVGIANIISRVTGLQSGLQKSKSMIDGTLRSTANLFLLNPAGVMFGANARLDVSGSFHVSTANYIGFGRGEPNFSAKPAKGELLSMADPTAFGFLGSTSARISIAGSSLEVPLGKILSVVGGDVMISGRPRSTTLAAPRGRIQIVSVGSKGEVPLSGDVNVSSFARLGKINISGGALINAGASDGPGGTILIRGGTLIVNNSRLLADTSGKVNGDPRGIDLQAENLVLENGAEVRTKTFGDGSAGNIMVNARMLTLTGGAAIQSQSEGPRRGKIMGNTGKIIVTATGSIEVSGRDPRKNPSQIVSETLDNSTGNGGEMVISAPSMTLRDGGSVITRTAGDGRGGGLKMTVGRLSLTNGAQIKSDNTSSGHGGNITVKADSVILSGACTSRGACTGILSASKAEGTGDISLNVGELTLRRGAQIASGGSLLEAGNVMITASDSVVIFDTSGISSQAFGQKAGVVSISAPTLAMDNGFINTSTLGAGDAGDISVDVGKLALTGGAQIVSSSQKLSRGHGGHVTVRATDSVVMSGRSSTNKVAKLTSSNDTSSGVFSTAEGSGAAGRVSVVTPTLTMSDGGKISVRTSGTERATAGDVDVNVGNLTLTSGAQMDSSTTSSARGGSVTVRATQSINISGRSSGLFSTASGEGDAGQIAVTAPTLSLADSAALAVTTLGEGNAGNIAVKGGQVTVAGGARIDSGSTGVGRGGTVSVTAGDSLTISGGSGLFSNAEGKGPGGNIDLRAGKVLLTNGGIISAKSSGTGDAGSVAITAAKSFRSQNSVVTTEAVQADGGNISLIGGPGSLVYLRKSQITTSVESGKGKGGNITIDPQFVILDHSRIRADAFGGPGGNVRIVADVYLTTDSLVSASSALGVPGTVNIQASITNVSGSLARLPEAVLQAAALLRASCAARLAGGKSSSLVLGGRDSVPPEPGGLLPSPLLPAGPLDDRLSRSQGHRWETLPGFSRTVLDPMCSR